MNKPAPKTVLQTVLDWSATRPLWQRDALRRIVTDGMPDEAGILEILSLCHKDNGATDVDLTAVPLAIDHLPAIPPGGASVTLRSISNVAGVNQLAPAQTLGFETAGLTVIYGPNGAGKSGYGRILKRACRSRKAGAIMPDAFAIALGTRATASIAVALDGIPRNPIAWIDSDSPDQVMSAISVFDKDCGSVHLREKNAVAFRPFGLDIPDDLAALCQKIKEKLTEAQRQTEALKNPVFAKPTWDSQTDVGRIMSTLKHSTDLAALEGLGVVSTDELDRWSRLTEDLQKNPIEAAEQTRIAAAAVGQLASTLQKMTDAFSDSELLRIKGLFDLALAKRAAATFAAEEAFAGLPLAGVGEETWRSLWDAARHYSQHVAFPDKPFPAPEGEACVLCHQILSADAKRRMDSFEAFVQADTETHAVAAEFAATSALKIFKTKKLDIRLIGATRRRIAVSHPDLARSVLRFYASADLRRLKLLGALQSTDAIDLPAFTLSPYDDLIALENQLQSRAHELDLAADVEGRRKLTAELASLTDRIAVKELLDVAKIEVARLATLHVLEGCLSQTSTTAITKLGNEIADEIITPRMRDQFQSEIIQLAAEKIRVEVNRTGGKFGSPQYQIQFFAAPTAKVELVLSEGEQTCVALAAFLTELATASHRSALVFDDPVTSLDHRWRRKVAERLVAELLVRQIVVFTHDLVFVNDLHELADRAGAAIKLVSLSRGVEGTGIAADGLPFEHASIKDRIDKLEKAARAAKILYEARDERGYRNDAVTIYGQLRAAWERGLEDILFAGVVLRHRDYINAKNLKKVTVLTEADVVAFQLGFKKCSDTIEAHDASRGRDAEPPAPTDLVADIQALSQWAASLRARQNAVV